jgi:site-specific recombinase XerC
MKTVTETKKPYEEIIAAAIEWWASKFNCVDSIENVAQFKKDIIKFKLDLREQLQKYSKTMKMLTLNTEDGSIIMTLCKENGLDASQLPSTASMWVNFKDNTINATKDDREPLEQIFTAPKEAKELPLESSEDEEKEDAISA